MDLALAPEQIELRDLARQILTDRCRPEHLTEIAATESATDLDLWRTLADAGLVGIGLPESAAGGGYGWLETAVVLSELGRSATPVPGFAVMALAAPALAERPDLLDGVASGSRVVTAAIHEPNADPWTPTTAAANGRLTGTKICVPHGTACTSSRQAPTASRSNDRTRRPGFPMPSSRSTARRETASVAATPSLISSVTARRAPLSWSPA